MMHQDFSILRGIVYERQVHDPTPHVLLLVDTDDVVSLRVIDCVGDHLPRTGF